MLLKQEVFRDRCKSIEDRAYIQGAFSFWGMPTSLYLWTVSSLYQWARQDFPIPWWIAHHNTVIWDLRVTVNNDLYRRVSRPRQVATLASSDIGLATFQEISITVSFISAQNPLLPDGYSNLPTYSVFAEETRILLAKNYTNRAGNWCFYFFPCSHVKHASNLKLGGLFNSPRVLRNFNLTFILSSVRRIAYNVWWKFPFRSKMQSENWRLKDWAYIRLYGESLPF